MALEITSARPDPALFDLPWSIPLEDWPDDHLAALPRGISRHIVRFVKLSGGVLAVKEIKADIAAREYAMLRALGRLRTQARIGQARTTAFGGIFGAYGISTQRPSVANAQS